MTFLKISIYKSLLEIMQIFIPLSDKFWISLFDEGFICEDKLTIETNSSLFSHLLENSSISCSVVVREYFRLAYSD